MTIEETRTVELENEHAMIDIPATAVELRIEAKVFLDGKVQTVERTMTLQEIRRAMKDAEDFIAEDDQFCLTEKGRDLVHDYATNEEAE